MSVFEQIIQLLNNHSVEYEVIHHEYVHTSQDAAKVRSTTMDMGAKALIFMADKEPIMLVCPGDKKVDTKAFKNQFNIKDMQMAPAEYVLELTGLKIGSIPPFGSLLGVKAWYFDEEFLQKDLIAFNAGDHCISLKMKSLDLVNIEKPKFGNYTKI